MGLPEIFISFETAAVTAIHRSGRGVVCLLVQDDTAGGQALAAYNTLQDVPQSQFTAENYRTIALAFRAGPKKVIVARSGADDQALLDTVQADWIAAPAMDADALAAYVKARRAGGRGVKAVVAGADKPDCEGVVDLLAEELVLTDGAIDAAAYTARIAGLLAAMPLDGSATFTALPEVVSCGAYEDAEAAVESGHLVIVGSGEGYRLGRAVTSLTTLTAQLGAPFRKIKIVEGVDLIRGDIARAFERGYVGKVLNDYDNKLLLVTAVNGYLDGLRGQVLDRSAENRCQVSLSGQRSWLESRGVDTADMTEGQILRANTGSQVFLEASLTFCDAMEDLYLVISM